MLSRPSNRIALTILRLAATDPHWHRSQRPNLSRLVRGEGGISDWTIGRVQVDQKRKANEDLDDQIQQQRDQRISMRAINAVVKKLKETPTTSSLSHSQLKEALKAMEHNVNMPELQRRKPKQDIKELLEKLADLGKKLPLLAELHLHLDEFMATQDGKEAANQNADDDDEGEDTGGDVAMMDDDGGEGSAEQVGGVELVAESQSSEMALDVEDEQTVDADLEQVFARLDKFGLSFQESVLDKSDKSAPPRFDRPETRRVRKD